MIKGDILLKNNTGITPKEVLIDGFVIRNQEYEFILNSLLNGFSNFFIVGQRGSGKTYLLHRLKYGIEDNEVLSQSIIPIIYSEEQYYLSDLIDLWESVFDYLEEKEGWRGIKKLKGELSEDPFAYENELTKILILKLEESKKHIYLLVENLNVFFKKIGKVGQQRLKQILTESEVIHLIGASTAVNDGNNDFGSSFYDFLKIIYLKGLTKYECSKLLIKIGQQYGKEDEIKFIIKKTPGRIESLRRLTGGVPRTISYLFQIFLDNENGKAIKDLYQLIDSLTNLYKSELDGLSTQQQKIIDIIARNWDAISVRDIVKLTRYESKNVSSLLSTLEKNQIIEVIQTRNKNNLYRIKERFLNIWYLMRFGKKHDRENVIWLVRFFDAWCDKSELAKRVADHINQLEGGNFDLNAAIDMGNTFLSCQNISESLKYLLYTTTQSVLPDKMKKKLRISDSVLYKKISELMEDANFDKAFSILNEVEDKGTVYESFLSWFHLMRGEIDESIKSGKKVLDLEPHNPLAAISLGIIYQDYYRDIENAEYYLKLALQYGHPYAGTRLGDIAYYFRGDLETAQTYHQQAIKKK